MKNKLSNVGVFMKEGAIALLASAMVICCMPLQVYAEDVGIDEIVDTNTDTVDINYGTIYSNEGIVTKNASGGTILTNFENGIIGTNNGYVDVNQGHIYQMNDTGTVITNTEGGQIEGVGGTIEINIGGSVCSGSNTGSGDIKITDYYSGELSLHDTSETSQGKITITNNYSGELMESTDNIVVKNQYYNITMADIDNATATYAGSGVSCNNYNDNEYLQIVRNEDLIPIDGIITLTPNEGYKITDNGTLSSDSESLGYIMTKNPETGAYTITLTSLDGSVTLTPAAFNLIISALTNGNNNQVKIDNSINVSSEAEPAVSVAGTITTADIARVESETIKTSKGIITSKIDTYLWAGCMKVAILESNEFLHTTYGLYDDLMLQGFKADPTKSSAAFASLNGYASSVGATLLQDTVCQLTLRNTRSNSFNLAYAALAIPAAFEVPKEIDQERKCELIATFPGGLTVAVPGSIDNGVFYGPVYGGNATYAWIVF